MLGDPQVEVGTGQEDMVLCYQGILHNYHNSHHTSALALEEGAHSPAGCLQRKVVEVGLQELAGKLLEELVLVALEDTQQQEQQAPAQRLDTGYGEAVLH